MNDSLNKSTNTSLISSNDFRLYTNVEVTILSILFVIALVGNLLVILKLTFFRHKNPLFNTKSQTRMSFFIVNLCFADLCVAFTSILPQAIWRYNNVFWSTSDLICKLTTFLQVSLIKIIFTLLLIIT